MPGFNERCQVAHGALSQIAMLAKQHKTLAMSMSQTVPGASVHEKLSLFIRYSI